MFGKDEETGGKPVATGGDARSTSILAQGCSFKGEVEIQGVFRVEGDFDGTIRTPEQLVIGKTGVVRGDVHVKNAIIGGRVVGNITAETKIELQSGSHVEGDIRTRRLVIDEGVFFEGNCSMGDKKPMPDSKGTRPAQGASDVKRQVTAS
jgi:cytoskeletal protein CcmA (bactofilin family)